MKAKKDFEWRGVHILKNQDIEPNQFTPMDMDALKAAGLIAETQPGEVFVEPSPEERKQIDLAYKGKSNKGKFIK